MQDEATPLHAAALNGHLKVVHYLTNCKVDPSQPNKVLSRAYGARDARLEDNQLFMIVL